tara:strand:+ start:7074 stop:9080 length:2007 start_codon:yes stop_codon:yes gene_type:complete
MTATPPAGNDDQALKDLLKAMQTANTLAENAAKARATAEKARSDKKDANKKQSAQSQLSRKALLGVNKLQSGTMKQLNSAFQSGLKMQEKSLGRGMGLGIVLSETTAQQEQLAGTVTGFGEAVEIGYEQFESGLKSSNAATNQLAAYTKVTGGNSLKLLKGMSKLTRGMSLSTEQETALMSSVQGLSQNYKMTSEELMDSLAGLEKGMRAFKLMGVGAEMAEAGVKISAALGKQGGDMGTKLLETLTSAEGQFTAAALGVNDERLALLKGEGDATQNALQMVVKAGTIAKDRIDQMVRGGADPAVAIAALEKTMGQGFGDAALVLEQLDKEAGSLGISLEEHVKRVGEKQELDKNFNASWNNFVSQVFSPLKETVMKLTTGFLDFITQNKDMAVKIGKVIVGLAALISALVTLSATQKLMSVAGVTGEGGMVSAIMKGLKRLGPMLLSAFQAIPGIGWIVAAIVAVGAIIYHFRDEIADFFIAGWEILKNVGTYIWDGIKWTGNYIYDGVKTYITRMIDSFKVYGTKIWEGMKWVGNYIWDGITSLPGKLITGIWDIMKWVGEKIANAFNPFGEDVEEPKIVGSKQDNNSAQKVSQTTAQIREIKYLDSAVLQAGAGQSIQANMEAVKVLEELKEAQLVSNAIAAQGVEATNNVNKPSPRQARTGSRR